MVSEMVGKGDSAVSSYRANVQNRISCPFVVTLKEVQVHIPKKLFITIDISSRK
jgi:hypothetical protein